MILDYSEKDEPRTSIGISNHKWDSVSRVSDHNWDSVSRVSDHKWDSVSRVSDHK